MKIGFERARTGPRRASPRKASPAPSDSRFRHQVYTERPPAAACIRLKPTPGPALCSGEARFRLRRSGEILRAAGVGAIYVVQGGFAALDAAVALAELARQYPAGSSAIQRLIRELHAPAAGEPGRFTSRYADALETLLAAGGDTIPVRLLEWSCENHHLGRADAAVRLIDELAALELPPQKRVLLFGHGHAGNAFALASSLLAGDAQTLEQFFTAAAIYYRLPMTGVVDVPVWRRVERLLAGSPKALARRPLDFVTFGAPVRYGWGLRRGDALLHFVNHRPLNGLPPHLAQFPPKLGDVLAAAGGDYLQQLGIAGSDTPPNRTAWRARLANRRLATLLENDLAAGSLVERLKLGMRVPETGMTLLVDYGPSCGELAQHLAGHAVYARSEWLLFHVEEIVRRLYATAGLGSQAA